MQRYDRSRFFAFGVLPTLNLLGLLLHGLMLSTSSTGGNERSVPILLAIAGICAIISLSATIKRGRDIGWPAWQTAILFWITLSFGPLVLGLIGYFAIAKPKESAERFGPPASQASVTTWGWAVLNLLWPWMILAVLAKVL